MRCEDAQRGGGRRDYASEGKLRNGFEMNRKLSYDIKTFFFLFVVGKHVDSGPDGG